MKVPDAPSHDNNQKGHPEVGVRPRPRKALKTDEEENEDERRFASRRQSGYK